MTPRAYTRDEIQEKFLSYVAMLVDYWEHETRKPTKREALEGLAFSILVALDGGTELPPFAVIPVPHESDEEYHKSEEENWYPYDKSIEENPNDIAGGLHDQIHKYYYKR